MLHLYHWGTRCACTVDYAAARKHAGRDGMYAGLGAIVFNIVSRIFFCEPIGECAKIAEINGAAMALGS